MYDAIRLAGSDLGHFHVGECNRKLPGEGNSINWAEIGKALRDIHYDGCVVMEPFEIPGGEVGRSIRVWRDLTGGDRSEATMTAKVKKSLQFLKKNLPQQKETIQALSRCRIASCRIMQIMM